MKLVYGVGVNDKKGFWNTKEYRLWTSMLKRCYSHEYQSKTPAYIGCTVSENFKRFSYFYDWCQKQIGFNVDGFDLDKDILKKGNKIYSEENCSFVPRCINTALERCGRSRGEYPIGVYHDKRKGQFKSYMRINGKMIHLGYHDCPLNAFESYKLNKENHIKEMAEKHKYSIHKNVYKSLMGYTVDLGD